MTGQLPAASGTLAGPGYTFSGDLNTGIYRAGADQMVLVCGGVAIATLTATGMTVNAELNAAGGGTSSVKQTGLGSVPVGSLMDYAGTSAPSGWLLCFGQSLLRADYPDLFTAIGTTYGAADGTHFTLPDCEGRVVAAKDNMSGVSKNRLTGQTGGVNGDNLGAVGGAETHTLLEAQLPAIVPAGSVSITVTIAGVSALPFNTIAPVITGGSSFNAYVVGGSSGSSAIAATGSFSGNSFGSNVPHNNVQPTIIFNKIIYTGVA